MTAPPSPQERYEAALAALTPQQRRFVAEYLVDLHGECAATRAGYSPKTARFQASRLLTNVNIRSAINAGMDLHAMPEPEILIRLTRIARGSIADVLRLPSSGAEPPAARGDSQSAGAAAAGWAIDLARAQETGAIHLIESIKEGRYGPELRLYSAHEALRDLAKIRGMTIDRKEISGPGGGAIPLQAFTQALTTAYDDDSDDNQGDPAAE